MTIVALHISCDGNGDVHVREIPPNELFVDFEPGDIRPQDIGRMQFGPACDPPSVHDETLPSDFAPIAPIPGFDDSPTWGLSPIEEEMKRVLLSSRRRALIKELMDIELALEDLE